jgi:hypothetical protein
MKAYIIEQKSSMTKFITSDFMDVWTMVDESEDNEPIIITPREMTVKEFEQEVKLNSIRDEDKMG